MTTQCTTGCGRPAPHSALCRACTSDLTSGLRAVPWIARELDVTLARLDRQPAPAGASTDSGTPLPIRWKAVQAGDTLRHTLAPWAVHVADRHRLPPPAGGHPATVARWLLEHADRIGVDPDAAQLVDEITYAIGQARRVVDHPPDLVYLGPCGPDCDSDLYLARQRDGWPSGVVVTCRACSTAHDAARRREWLMDAVRDRLATAGEISRAIPGLYGRAIHTGTIRQWIARGRLMPRAWLVGQVIHPHRPASHARALLRVGDVLDLAERTARDR